MAVDPKIFPQKFIFPVFSRRDHATSNSKLDSPSHLFVCLFVCLRLKIQSVLVNIFNCVNMELKKFVLLIAKKVILWLKWSFKVENSDALVNIFKCEIFVSNFQDEILIRKSEKNSIRE